MNAEQAAELIAEFIDSDYPKDKDRVYKIIRLGMNRAWKEGKWFGMSAEFFVSVQTDGSGKKFITSPRGYSTLLALNVGAKKTIPRDQHFMFHRNGYGDIKSASADCNWNEEDFYEEGVKATIVDFDRYFPNGAILGVRSLSDSGENEKVTIQGEICEGEEAVSFEKININSDASCFKATEDSYIRTVHGVRFDVNQNLNYVENFIFTSVRSIVKTHTRGIVEVYGFDSLTGNGYKIATLYPWETEARYKRYMIPNSCCDCVHGLFKIDIQPDIIDGSQPIIINDEEAIICLAKGIYNMYHKDDIEKGQAFLLQAFNCLEKQKREEEVEDVFPIQIIGAGSEDIPEIIKTY